MFKSGDLLKCTSVINTSLNTKYMFKSVEQCLSLNRNVTHATLAQLFEPFSCVFEYPFY